MSQENIRTKAERKDLSLLIFICSFSFSFFCFPQSYEQNDFVEGRAQIQDVVRSIIDVLSKPHNSTLLLALREVRVDTQDPRPQVGE